MTKSANKMPRRRRNTEKNIEIKTKFRGFGGSLKILDQGECDDIHKAVLYILSEIG